MAEGGLRGERVGDNGAHWKTGGSFNFPRAVPGNYEAVPPPDSYLSICGYNDSGKRARESVNSWTCLSYCWTELCACVRSAGLCSSLLFIYYKY
jgi:hypothetical protein